MGCAVNGPGEAGNADFGIAGGRDAGFIYAHGEVLRKVPQDAARGRALPRARRLDRARHAAAGTPSRHARDRSRGIVINRLVKLVTLGLVVQRVARHPAVATPARGLFHRFSRAATPAAGITSSLPRSSAQRPGAGRAPDSPDRRSRLCRLWLRPCRVTPTCTATPSTRSSTGRAVSLSSSSGRPSSRCPPSRSPTTAPWRARSSSTAAPARRASSRSSAARSTSSTTAARASTRRTATGTT